jgi:hypothetical protein
VRAEAETDRNNDGKWQVDRFNRVEVSKCAKGEGIMCLIAEIVHTCSNEKVAQAAVASMGTEFASKVGKTARLRGMTVGAFTAETVLRFDRSVGEKERQALREAMKGADQPILFGLHQILQPALFPDGGATTRH